MPLNLLEHLSVKNPSLVNVLVQHFFGSISFTLCSIILTMQETESRSRESKDTKSSVITDTIENASNNFVFTNYKRFKNKLSSLKKPFKPSREAKLDRQTKSKLGDPISTCLLVLHSSRMAFVLALISVARMAATICGSIFILDSYYSTSPRQTEDGSPWYMLFSVQFSQSSQL